MEEQKQGVGATKWIGIVSALVTLVAAVVQLPPAGSVLLCSPLFGLVVLYCVHDICSWYWLTWVWVFGLGAIVLTASWWIAFLARHSTPQPPLPPGWATPANWVYIPILTALVCYCEWDMCDAIHRNWHDKDDIMLLGSCVVVELFALAYFTWAA